MDKKDEKQKMEKPISVAITEVKQGIAELINTSGLPIYIAELIIKDVYNDILQISNQIKEKEFMSYVQSQQIQKIEEENLENAD